MKQQITLGGGSNLDSYLNKALSPIVGKLQKGDQLYFDGRIPEIADFLKTYGHLWPNGLGVLQVRSICYIFDAQSNITVRELDLEEC